MLQIRVRVQGIVPLNSQRHPSNVKDLVKLVLIHRQVNIDVEHRSYFLFKVLAHRPALGLNSPEYFVRHPVAAESMVSSFQAARHFDVRGFFNNGAYFVELHILSS